eukprot:gene23115-27715_t
MATKLIAYDLNSPGQKYDDLIAAIKDLGAWWHHLDSTWLVKTTLSTSALRDSLKKHIDSGDELLVVDVTGDLVGSVAGPAPVKVPDAASGGRTEQKKSEFMIVHTIAIEEDFRFSEQIGLKGVWDERVLERTDRIRSVREVN